MRKQPITGTGNNNRHKGVCPVWMTSFRYKLSLFVTCSSYLLLVPVAVLATDPNLTVFTNTNPNLNITTLANKFSGIANVIIPFLIGVAFVVIVWGIFKYILHAGDSEQVAKGRMYIVYGVVALFLMLSFWGFVTIIHTSSFG